MLEWTGERFWYGSKILSEAASSVVAVDIDENSLGGLCYLHTQRVSSLFRRRPQR